MKFNRIIIKATHDMLGLGTIKLALSTGIPLLLLWLGIGWLLWNPMIHFTAWIISWIPFSIVRANGAFIVIFFIWIAAILISYALIIGLFSGFFLSDKKERRFEAINFTTIFILTLLWSYIIIAFWPQLDSQIQRLLMLLPFDMVAKGLASLLAIYIFYNLFLVSEYFIVFLFREPFLMALIEKHYPEFETITQIHSAQVYRTLYKDIAIFLIATFLSLPILFIPVANFLVALFIWAWLYKESAFLGVCSYLCTQKEYEKMEEYRGMRAAVSLVAALLNFVPIISIFTPFFIMSLYFHWIMEEKGA